jgi:predicted PurR-regulated permease PerM
LVTASPLGASRAVIALLGLAGAVIVVAAMKSFASVIGPAFLALMLTVAIHSLQKWLGREGLSARIGLVATLLATYGLLLGLLGALVLSFAQFATTMPRYKAKFDELMP